MDEKLGKVKKGILEDARAWMNKYPSKTEHERNIYHEGVMSALRAIAQQGLIPANKHTSELETEVYNELVALFDQDDKEVVDG